MHTESIDMVWIMVKDLKKAVKFYTEVVGLKLEVFEEGFGWAELQGHQGKGSRLGIAQVQDATDPIKPGQNAVVTMSVKNIEKAKEELLKKGAKCVGDIKEIPEHVKMQDVMDEDGNYIQIVEKLF